MTFKGLPSRGCEHCRRIKKRCGLERPACHRCVRQKRECVGYADVTQLLFRDQSQSVRAKVERQNTRRPRRPSNVAASVEASPNSSQWSPATNGSGSAIVHSRSGERDLQARHVTRSPLRDGPSSVSLASTKSLPIELRIQATDLATTYFVQQFTSETHWIFLRDYALQEHVFPCVYLALQACGMAALANIHKTSEGAEWAQRRYADSIALLNHALGQSEFAKSDESLIAVQLLAYYENVACERPQSIHSWRTHLDGATQLLKLRGKRQCKTEIGRTLFREMRRQIITCCIWNDIEPPGFLEDYQTHLHSHSSDAERSRWLPADQLNMLSHEYARLRSHLRKGFRSDSDAAHECTQLERRLADWARSTVDLGSRWTWQDTEIDESEDIWNGRLSVYTDDLAPEVWNNWRCMRVMVSRTQEMLAHRVVASQAERQSQVQQSRQVRRQMADEICATIPTCLGSRSRHMQSPKLVSAYACVWPLFFAATCAFERAGTAAAPLLGEQADHAALTASAACAQVIWVLKRLAYIADQAGLKWARGVTAPLRGRFRLRQQASNEL